MHYFALVEDWPRESTVFFRELPGCFVSAQTFEEAMQAASTAIAEYFRWLKKNEIVLEHDNEVVVTLKERLAAVDGQKGPRFEADLASPGDEELDIALNIAAAARAELLELYESVPVEKRNVSFSPDTWSLMQHLQHILEAERWYVSRLQDFSPTDLGTDLPTDLEMALFDNAMDAELFLRGLSLEERGRVFVHEGEEWTTGKVLRRMVEHLREHYPWMVAIKKELGLS